MHILGKVAGLLIVATCWGFTNPFIKRGTLGLDQVSAKYANASWIKRTVAEYVYLLTKWQFVLPLAINLSGSTFYYWTLGSNELSMAVPIANSLTFALTALAGRLLGEEFGSSSTLWGMSLIVLGVLLCITSK